MTELKLRPRQDAPLRATVQVLVVTSLEPFSYWFGMVPFQALVARLTGNDPLHLAALYCVLLLPAFFTNPFVGALADRFDRRKVGAACCAVSVLGTVGAGALAMVGTVPLGAVYALGTVVGLGHASALSVGQSLVAPYTAPSLVPRALTVQAIGINVARTLGPLGAGAVLVTTTTAVTFWTFSALSCLCIALLLTLPRRATSTGTERVRVLASVSDGLGHARRRPPAAVLLFSVAATSLLGISFLTQIPAIAVRAAVPATSFVYLNSALGLGSLVGVLLLGVVGTRRLGPRFVGSCQLLLGLTAVALAFARSVPTQAGLVALAGALQFAALTVSNVRIQLVIDESHRGRVMAVFQSFWSGLIPVGGLMLGALWRLLGGTAAMTTFGLATAVLSWALFRGRTRASRTDR